MVDWWNITKATASSVNGISSSLANGLARSWSRRAIRPGRRAFQTGILGPSDGPPSSTTGSFLDFREVLLPAQVAGLRTGDFPIGRAKDPQWDAKDGFPIFLSHEHLRRHAAIIGPSGSGKTHSLIAPWICCSARMGFTTVTVDTKGDLLLEMRGAKARLGLSADLPLILWDVDDPTRSWSWNPLAEATSLREAAQISTAILGQVDPRDPNRFFAERDHRWLRGAVTLARASHPGGSPHPAILYRMIVDQAFLRDCVKAAPTSGTEVIDLAQFTPSEYSRATSGLSNRLSWLADPSLRLMLSGRGSRSFTAQQALNQGTTVVVGGRMSGGERSMMAAAILLNLLRLRCLERYGGGQTPVMWILDEVPLYSARIQLDQMLAVLRGANSPVCIAMQHAEDLGDESEQSRLLGNCDVLIALNGVSELTAQYFSGRLGTTQAASSSMTMDEQGAWRPSLSHTTQPRLGKTEIMYPPVGARGAIVQIRSEAPHPFLVSFDEHS